MNFGERLRAFREGLGLSQEALSERTRTEGAGSITRVHISNLERGIHSPNQRTVECLEKALGLTSGSLSMQSGEAVNVPAESPAEGAA